MQSMRVPAGDGHAGVHLALGRVLLHAVERRPRPGRPRAATPAARWGWPACRRPGSVTSSARVPPSDRGQLAEPGERARLEHDPPERLEVKRRRRAGRPAGGPAAVEVGEEVAFMRLVPGQAVGRQRSDVQPLDVRAGEQVRDEGRVVGQAGGGEGVADPLQHVGLRVFYHRRRRGTGTPCSPAGGPGSSQRTIVGRSQAQRPVLHQPRACRGTSAVTSTAPGVFSPSSIMALMASATAGVGERADLAVRVVPRPGLRPGEPLGQPLGDGAGRSAASTRPRRSRTPGRRWRRSPRPSRRGTSPTGRPGPRRRGTSSTRCRGSRRGGRSCTGPCVRSSPNAMLRPHKPEDVGRPGVVGRQEGQARTPECRP